MTNNSPRWDQVALGEVMLRLDPGDTSMATLPEILKAMKGSTAKVER